MSEIIITALKDLKARRKELRALVTEYDEVEAAIQALEQVHGGPVPSVRKRGGKAGGGARRGRPRKGQPARSDQFLSLVREEPGISVADAAKRMSVQPNYLYRWRS